ncbi:ABC transporter ATP-binding protein [Bifidobacterium sp. ESL0775]|uniref:ABC transporter ATP-binding protein n=1 Tax=Bifidobacterium sp. ESL0775 TaxID=2983230 RepID=UPI0023F77927|nr:ABC transporter ATP-binding protein [Bifidobacterium sp. ESL0775]WEV68769.1 ABC transporter ATP-binding protein [Bifidobacterium sp. ESL0775]
MAHHTTEVQPNGKPGGTNEVPALVFEDAGIKRGERIIWQHGNFSIPSGSITAIVGTNGAGKTTMMKAELGLLPLASGRLTVLGGPAGTTNHLIGYVPQNYAGDIESNLTAEQSVLLGLTGTRFGIHPTTRAQRTRAREAMAFTGVDGIRHYRLSELSGGLRQRVAIAQALVSGPKLLMLDEPLANLDLAAQRETVHVLAKLNHEMGMTIQVVAHDLNMLLPILDGAVYLLDGHPHYARMNEVLDADLLTHLYGTKVQVVTTPQGDMFVTPGPDEPDDVTPDIHKPVEVARFHRHGGASPRTSGANPPGAGEYPNSAVSGETPRLFEGALSRARDHSSQRGNGHDDNDNGNDNRREDGR